MLFERGHDVNKGKRSRSGAGAPVPAPRTPHARRFRPHRALSSHPHRTGALETATAAALADAIDTDPSHAAVPLTAPAAPVAGKRRAGAAAPSSEACTDAQGMREQLTRNCAVSQASLQAVVAVVAAASSTAPIAPFSARVRSLSKHPCSRARARPIPRPGDGSSLLTRHE